MSFHVGKEKRYNCVFVPFYCIQDVVQSCVCCFYLGGSDDTKGFEIYLEGALKDFRCMLIRFHDNITTAMLKVGRVR